MTQAPPVKQVPPESPVAGVYRHYKGQLYQVLGMARHSETEEWLVVYQALYGERGFWLRPLSLWSEPVTQASEAPTERFTLIEANGNNLESVIQTG